MKKIVYSSKKTLWLMLIYVMCQLSPFCFQLYAGEVTGSLQEGVIITGKVESSLNGDPLPGVNVIEKGTTNGTVTNLDGEYTITVSDENAILSFSFVGYLQEEVPVNGKSEINMVLAEDIASLDEVIVVGYGSLKKRDIVGSVSTIDNKTIENNKSSASFVSSLQGMAAGLSVQSNSGVPGAGEEVLIRGLNSFDASVGPLWIIDGMPINNNTDVDNYGAQQQSPMALINPADIESIQVLKDAGATAIYGSRGSNGVIIVTTKSGKKDQGGIQINYSTGMSELTRTPEDIGFCNTKEWFSILDVAAQNDSLDYFDPQYTYTLQPDAETFLTREEALANNTNWFNHILQTGSYQDINISTTTSSENMNMFLSGNYRKDKSVVKYNELERFSTRGKMNFSPVKNLDIGANISLSHTKNNRVPSDGQGSLDGNLTGHMGGFSATSIHGLPWYPVYDSTGKYYNPAVYNPVASIDPENFRNYLTTYRGIGAFSTEYTVPFIEGLAIRAQTSFDVMQSNLTAFTSEVIREPGSQGREEASIQKVFNNNIYMSYHHTWGKHSISAVLGSEGQRNSGYRRYMVGRDIDNPYQQLSEVGALVDMEGRMTGERFLLSYFSRINYKFNERYILGLSYRRDGSSKFPKDLRWGNFTAISAGWIITEENFMDFAGDALFLKLRGSFGQTGNEGIPANRFIQNYKTNFLYGSQDIYGRLGTMPSNLVSGVTWEITNSYDGGLDFGLFNNRVSGSVAYYYRQVDNLLVETPLPISTGISATVYNYDANKAWGNIGRLDNSGVELEIASVNIHHKNFKWTTNFNFGTNHNILQRIDNQGNNIIEGYKISTVGNAMREWYLARYVDVDPETGIERLYALDREHFEKTGETRTLQALDGSDSLIYASSSNIKKNMFRHEGKTATPTYYGGITNTFEFLGFDLGFYISFSGGNYIFDYNEQVNSTIAENRTLRKDVVGNYWEKPGDIAKYPKPKLDPHVIGDDPETAQTYDLSRVWCGYDKYLYKGDYIRLKNVQIGYTLPEELLDNIGIQHLRVYASGTNLFTITKYPGWDPEGSTQVYNAVIPQLKTYTIGVDLKF